MLCNQFSNVEVFHEIFRVVFQQISIIKKSRPELVGAGLGISVMNYFINYPTHLQVFFQAGDPALGVLPFYYAAHHLGVF